jgi:Amt family ammonium transporter
VFANAEARREMGWEGEWQDCPVEDVLWGLLPGTAEPRTTLIGGERGSAFHATLACIDGRMTAVEGTYCVPDPEMREGIVVAQVSGRDHTPRPGLMEDVLASLPEAVVLVVGKNVIYTNPAFTTVFGFTAEEASGGSLADLIIPDTRAFEHLMLQKMVDDKGLAGAETVRLNKNGEFVDVALQMTALRVAGGKAGYVLTFRDISERKQVEARLQHDAMHDILTGLPNRALFIDRLTLALSRRDRGVNQGCAVFFMDVDQFKQINDKLGHAAGDMLLIGMAERLLTALRPHDTAARLGGDEFGVLVENIMSVGDVDAVAQRLLVELDRPYELLGHRVQVPASIGIALATDRHGTADELIQEADLAMYRAKQEGGHRYTVFDRHLEVRVTSRQERERELRDIVARRDLVYWYQPIYRLATGRLEGFELLLRRRTSSGAPESFMELLPVAEDTGLSISIGRDAVEAACAQLMEWDRKAPGNGTSIAVNLTQRQFHNEELVPHLKRTLADTRLDPARLLFEVAENTVNEDPDRALALLQRLVDCGVRMVMDNFGAGLAPLNHLMRLPLHVVKLDPRITASVTGAGRNIALVQSLIHLCRASGVELLAEGIETPAHLRILQDLGCELGQGHFLAPPMEPTQAEYLAANNQPGGHEA